MDNEDPPWCPAAKTAFPMQRVWVGSLVRELDPPMLHLRSCMPQLKVPCVPPKAWCSQLKKRERGMNQENAELP